MKVKDIKPLITDNTVIYFYCKDYKFLIQQDNNKENYIPNLQSDGKIIHIPVIIDKCEITAIKVGETFDMFIEIEPNLDILSAVEAYNL